MTTVRSLNYDSGDFLYLAAANCDPKVETCGEGESAVERALPNDFYALTSLYILWPVGSIATLRLTENFIEALLPEVNVAAQGDWYMIPVYLTSLVNVIPFFLSLVYLLLGADFFLLLWVDNLLVWLIKHWVSNFSFLFNFVIFIPYWIFYAYYVPFV